MKILKFTAAYVNFEWLQPAYVCLDSKGCLLSIGGDAPSEKTQLEEVEGYLIPGMANAHSHSFQYAMAGMAEHVRAGHLAENFWTWREQMYRLALRIDPEQLLELSTQFYMSLLEEGFTSVCEFHYLHHDPLGKAYARPYEMSAVLMEAARRAGIHLTLTPIYYNQAAPGVALKTEQRRFYFADVDSYLHLLEQVSTYARDHYPEVIVGYGVHSMRAAPLGDIKSILATHWAIGPAHLHVSEQSEDVRAFEEAYRIRAVDWLYDNVPLDVHHNLIHATHINSLEIRKLAASGATVVLCPSTEANLGDGIFPLPDFHALGGSWCIGTDSHVNLSPWLEMRSPELVHRLLLERRNILCRDDQVHSGTIIFDRVHTSGRKALGLSHKSYPIGQSFEGIVLDPDHDRLLERPLDQVLDILVFAGDKSLIHSVYSQGERQVLRGQHHRRLEHRSEFRRVMKDLLREDEV